MSNPDANGAASRLLAALVNAAGLQHPRDEAFIRSLGSSPELQELVQREQLRSANGRAELVSRAAALRAEAAERSTNKSWHRRCEEAVRRVDRAQDELRQATEALTATRAAFDAYANEPMKQAILIERDLNRQADRRVYDFRGLLRTLEGEARCAARIFLVDVPSGPRGAFTSKQVMSNSEELAAALAAIDSVYAALGGVDLTALTFEEVTARLVQYCDQLRPPLHALGLRQCVAIDARSLSPQLVPMLDGQAVLSNGQP